MQYFKPTLALAALTCLALPSHAQFGSLLNAITGGSNAPKAEQAAQAAQGTPSIAQATRQLARRQIKWFRRDHRIHWLDAADPETATREALAILGSCD